MGQKVNPHGLRVGIIKDWNSRWYADTKDGAFANNLVEDHKIREYLKKRLKSAGVSKIDIERAGNRIKVTVLTAKPGIAIGDNPHRSPGYLFGRSAGPAPPEHPDDRL